MKTFLTSAARSLVALAFVACFCAVVVESQARDPRIITVRAGGVNFTAGDVQFQSIGETKWKQLTIKHDLQSGDLVRTGVASRAEILLNPGSYVRLGPNSEFEFEDTSLETLRVKLYKGSAVVEATGYDGIALAIAFDTPQTTSTIIQRGVYRFNVTPDNVTELMVQRGKLLVGGEPPTVVTGGKLARIAGGTVQVAKYDKKKQRDELDNWSKSRAEELARMNRSLQMRETRAMIMTTDFSGLNGRFNTLGSFGVWVFNRANGCYTFLPFYYGWETPYGGWYGSYWAYAPLCGSCGYRPYGDTWNNNSNDTWQPSSNSNPKYSPPATAPTSSNPIPVTRSSDGPTFSPSGKSKP